MKTWGIFALFCFAACTRPNPDASLEICKTVAACGAGFYSLCTRNGCNTRYVAGASSFACASCTDCVGALAQTVTFCRTATGTDKDCATKATNDCLDCCVSHHPSGDAHYNQLLQSCECTNPGECATDCAASFCGDITMTDAVCNACIQSNAVSGGTCDVSSRCRADGDCNQLIDCVTACP